MAAPMQFPNPFPLPRVRTWFVVLLLAALVAGGALLRFHRLGVPSLWLDEILTYEIAEESGRLPPWAWLTGFERRRGRRAEAHPRRSPRSSTRIRTASITPFATVNTAAVSQAVCTSGRAAISSTTAR